MVLGEEEKRFYGGIVTVIPPNYPHTTNSDIGTVSKWEYLFIDVEGFMKKFLDNPVKAEKVIQRIYSRALFFEEKENLSISKKIHKILDIMRDGEEFFLEEAKGVLAALLVEIARLNRDSGEDKVAENAGKLTNMITSVLDYVSYHYMEDIKVEDRSRSYESGNTSGVADNIPGIIIHDHVEKHITRKHLFLDLLGSTVTHFHNFLQRNANLQNLVFQVSVFDCFFNVGFYFVFIPGISMNYIPFCI